MTDQEFKRMLTRDIKDAPYSPWFTRKVMNRLTPRQSMVSAVIEYMVYLCSFIGLCFSAVGLWQSIDASRAVTVSNLLYGVTVISLMCGILYLSITPILRASK